MKTKQVIGIVIIIITTFIIRYEVDKDRQIINLLNGFSKSTKCEVTLPAGDKIIIEGAEWKNIIKNGVSFSYDDNGRKTYKGLEMVNLMEVKIYESNKIISELQIKEIVSSDEELNEIYENANFAEQEPSTNGEQNQTKYYDVINGRKIISISGENYIRGINEFLQPLFKFISKRQI